MLPNISYHGKEISDKEIFDVLPIVLQNFLSETNGLIAYNGAIHFRGCVYEPRWHSIREIWQENFPLHEKYELVKKGDIPFAQDYLGDQFLLRDAKVIKLYAETGEVEELNFSFEEFLSELQKSSKIIQPDILESFLSSGKEIFPGESLSIYPPLCTVESSSEVSMRPVPVFERLRFLADFYLQIKDLPDGTKIEINIT